MRSRLCFVTISLSFAPDRGAWALSAFGLWKQDRCHSEFETRKSNVNYKKKISMHLYARHATGSSQIIMNISEHETFLNSVRIFPGDFSNATLCTLFIHIC